MSSHPPVESSKLGAQAKRITRSVAVAQLKRDGSLVTLNSVFCDFLGVHDPQPLIGQHAQHALGNAWELIHPHIEQVLAGNVVEFTRSTQWGHKGAHHIRVRIIPLGHDTQTLAHTGIAVMLQDITSEEQIRQTLHAQAQLLKLIQQNTSGIVSYQTADRRFVFVNQGVCTAIGLTQEQIIGKTVDDIDLKQEMRLTADELADLRKGIAVSRNSLITHADGTLKHYQFYVQPHVGALGEYLGHFITGTNINSVVNARTLLENITNAIDIPIVLFNSAFCVDFANVAAAKMWGRSPLSLIGCDFSDLVQPDRVDLVRDLLTQVMQTGRPIAYEHTMPHAQLGMRHMRVCITANPDNTVHPSVIVNFVDIQADFDLRNQLAEREHRLQATLQALPGVLSFQDPQRRFQYVNENFLDTFGFTREQVIGKTPAELFGRSSLQMSADEHSELALGKPELIERQITSQSGEPHWFEFRVEPRFDTHGAFEGHFAIGLNIDARRKVEAKLAEKDLELRSAIDAQPSGMAYLLVDGTVAYANSTYAKWYGVDRDKVIGKKITEFLNQEQLDRINIFWNQARPGKAVQGEREFELPDGSIRSHLVSYAPRYDQDNVLLGFLIVSIDVTDTKIAQQNALLAERQLALHMQNTPLAVIESDSQRCVRHWSAKAHELLGWSEVEVLGKTPEQIGLFQPTELASYRTHLEQLFAPAHATQGAHSIWSARVRTKCGQEKLLEWHDSVLTDQAGNVRSILTLAQDITARVTAEQQLMYLATHDTLTGLPNRALMHEWLERTLKYAAEHQQHIAALFLDLDGFKEVNDSLGHRQGDILLQRVAQLLQGFTQASDIAVRLSGDEFLILINRPQLPSLSLLACDILRAISSPQLLSNTTVTVTGSLGYAVFPIDADNGSNLVRNADLAMYQAKAAGKNRAAAFSVQMAQSAAHRRATESALVNAIRERQMEVEYQPILAMNSGQIMGCEALVRWRKDATKDALLPGDFLEFAESSRAIYDMTCFVLLDACMNVVRWRKYAPQLVVSVNLSPSFIQSHDVAAEIMAALANTRCPADALKIEVTETVLMSDLEAVREKLVAVRALGVKIALDDFGTGYSSLTYLRQFPVDTVKIDRSFVARLPDSQQDSAIVGAVITLALAMNMDVVAEGVESDSQRAYLHKLGASSWQGFLFSKAIPAHQFDVLLLSKRR